LGELAEFVLLAGAAGQDQMAALLHIAPPLPGQRLADHLIRRRDEERIAVEVIVLGDEIHRRAGALYGQCVAVAVGPAVPQRGSTDSRCTARPSVPAAWPWHRAAFRAT